jgi:hypothetical protein
MNLLRINHYNFLIENYLKMRVQQTPKMYVLNLPPTMENIQHNCGTMNQPSSQTFDDHRSNFFCLYLTKFYLYSEALAVAYATYAVYHCKFVDCQITWWQAVVGEELCLLMGKACQEALEQVEEGMDYNLKCWQVTGCPPYHHF